MENNFSEKESLDLISRMISSARNNLQKGMGNIFLLWGYLVAGISLGTLVLLLILPAGINHYAYYLWFLMALGYPLHLLFLNRMSRRNLALTYVDSVMNWVWIAFSVTILTVIAGILILVVSGIPGLTWVKSGHEFLRWIPWLFLTPFMLCLYGFALFVSGKAYRFGPFVTGGILCWVFAFITFLFIHHAFVSYIQQAAVCISAIAGFVIPGHLLNGKEKSHVPGA